MRRSYSVPSIACMATRISEALALGWPPLRVWFTVITGASGQTARSTREPPSCSLWSDVKAFCLYLRCVCVLRVHLLLNAKALKPGDQVIASNFKRVWVLIQTAHHQGSFECTDDDRRDGAWFGLEFHSSPSRGTRNQRAEARAPTVKSSLSTGPQSGISVVSIDRSIEKGTAAPQGRPALNEV